MYKKDLALKTLRWLICHKTKPDRAKSPGIQYMKPCAKLS